MNYLIPQEGHEPFLTNWYDYENNYNEGMVIYNLLSGTYSTDGITFKEIQEDYL